MDERFRGRRREVARSRGRRRALALGSLLLVAAVVAGYFWLRASDVFALRQLSLPLIQNVTEAQLYSAVEPVAGVNLLRVPVAEVERRLRAIPYVRAARVYRRFPHTLEVDLTEYQPAAAIRAHDGDTWVISEDGRVLERVRESSPALVLVVPEAEIRLEAGQTVPSQVVDALPVLGLLHDPGVWPQEYGVLRLEVSDVGELMLILADGCQVRMGEPARLEEKLMVAARIIDRYSSEGKQVEYVDVHVPSPGVAKAK
ncbi:MAG: FtsQ-type POTRA domain-containing protein [Thermoleophilia bacterium]|nr:FtsQ-type POTRA domain-containing protein [Thermoleophilia bacterium]